MQSTFNAIAELSVEAEKIDIVVQDASYVNPRIDITDKVLKALSK